jgi:hypothetical protein
VVRLGVSVRQFTRCGAHTDSSGAAAVLKLTRHRKR